MKHISVTSSAIGKIGFDENAGSMVVTFHNGSTATHQACREEYEQLLNSGSIGSHYARHFKNGKAKPGKVAPKVKIKYVQ